MAQRIRKAVFPVAGLGTRFLPATKSMPKEMLTVLDRPIIQHVVDEAREAGIEQFIFVTGRGKSAIEDHFDSQFELEATLNQRGKLTELDLLRRNSLPAGSASFTRQQQPLGLGHAVLCAKELIGNEPFAVLLPDVIVNSPKRGGLGQLIDQYNRYGGNFIAVESVPEAETSKYGIVELTGGLSGGHPTSIRGIVEKPQPNEAPSNWAVLGRYILQPSIFATLANVAPGSGNEIQLTDAIAESMRDQPFYALEVKGQTFDCGNPIGFLLANVAYGLQASGEIGGKFRSGLAHLVAADARRQCASVSTNGLNARMIA